MRSRRRFTSAWYSYVSEAGASSVAASARAARRATGRATRRLGVEAEIRLPRTALRAPPVTTARADTAAVDMAADIFAYRMR